MYMSSAVCEATSGAPLMEPWNDVTGRCLREQELRAHEVLFCEGQIAEFLYEVIEGVMCNHRILLDGRRQVISFAYPGDMIGLGPSQIYLYGSEASCGARVRCIPKGALLHEAQAHADIGIQLLEIVGAELASLQEHQFLLARKCAVEKLAAFLLILVQRCDERDADVASIQLPMTRSDIADFLGMTIETVSRNMTKLKATGIIDLPQTATVVVKDVGRLKGLAEGGGGVL